MSIAARIRENKNRHPELYCPDKRCLWRKYNDATGEWTPCPMHEPGEYGGLTEDEIEAERRIDAAERKDTAHGC